MDRDDLISTNKGSLACCLLTSNARHHYYSFFVLAPVLHVGCLNAALSVEGGGAYGIFQMIIIELSWSPILSNTLLVSLVAFIASAISSR